MIISIGCDHAGVRYKETIKKILTQKGYEISDMGTFTEESCDYPVYAKKVCAEVTSGRAEKGILICGTGIGMSMASNKVKGIRAALCVNDFMAEFTRRHNDANVICLGARVIDEETAVHLVDIFLSTPFEGGRHQRRIDQLED